MLLTGTYPRTLDDKKRLALPKRLRDLVGEKAQLFVAPGQDQCLWIYDNDRLERLADKLDQTPATDAEARVFRRLFFAQMEAVLVLATVAQAYHFTIDPAHPVELDPAVTLRPRSGVRAPLKRRLQPAAV